jgi:hypothetical protein
MKYSFVQYIIVSIHAMLLSCVSATVSIISIGCSAVRRLLAASEEALLPGCTSCSSHLAECEYLLVGVEGEGSWTAGLCPACPGEAPGQESAGWY